MPAAPLVAVAGTAGGGAPCAVPLPQRQLRLGAALRRVARQEGVLSLWRGNGVTILHRLPYSSINFLTYEWASEYLQQHMPPEQDVGRRLAAGALAGLVACSAVSSHLPAPLASPAACGCMERCRSGRGWGAHPRGSEPAAPPPPPGRARAQLRGGGRPDR